MQGEHAVENLGRNKVVVRTHQLNPDDGGFNSSNDEEDQRIENVEDAQALVIYGGDPLVQRLKPCPVRAYSGGLNGYRIR